MKRQTGMCYQMEMLEISVERQSEYESMSILSPVLFNIFLEKIMQKGLTPVN